MSQSVRTYRKTDDEFFRCRSMYVCTLCFSKTPLYGKTAEFTAVFWSEKSRQVKSAKNLTVDRNGFTESCFSEQQSSCAEMWGITRLETKSHGTGKSVGVTCEQDITPAILNGFDGNRYFYDTAKRIRRKAYRLRFFII